MTTGATVCAVAALAIFAAVSFIHLRHAGLTIFTTISPLPGLAIVHFGPAFLGVPAPAIKLEVLVAAFCLFGAEILAASFVARVVEGYTKTSAIRATLATAAVVLLVAMVTTAIFVLAWLPVNGLREAVAIELLLAGGSVLLLMPLGALAIFLNEDFIARANRAREWRERLLENVSAAAFPRWGFTIFGVGLVFAALGFFGAHLDAAHNVTRANWLSIAIAFAAVAVASGIVTRDWRRALALFMSIAFVALLGLWIFGGIPSHGTAQIALSLALGASLLSMLRMAVQHRRYAVLPEAANGAGAHAIVTIGSMVIFAAFAVTGFLGVWVVAGFVALRVVLVVLAGCTASLLLYPAICAVLETLLPRRATLAARYRLP